MIIFLLVSLLFIVIGVLIRFFKCYWLISGYNTMSMEKRKNVDADGLGKLMGDFCFAIAAILIIAWILNYYKLTMLMMIDLGLIFISSIYILIKAQKYDYNTQNGDGTLNKGTKIVIASLILFLVIVFSGVGILLYNCSLPPIVNVSSNYIEIKGMYGMKILMKDIKVVDLKESIPKIISKTNGSDLGSRLKGNFKIEGIGIAKIYINKDSSPFIYLLKGNEYIIINFDDPNKTKSLYQNIKSYYKKQ